MVKRWTVIKHSGQADVLQGPKSESSPKYSYLALLAHYYRDIQSGGSNYDRANMLLADGKVVIEKDLHELAWDYGSALRKAQEEATRAIGLHHNKEF